MHSRQASKFALYRAQTPNRGKYRGKGLEFVTGEMRDSEGRSLLIRRHCIGYVVFDTLYLTLYPTLYHVLYTGLYRSVVPCTLYPGLYHSLYRSAVSYTTSYTLVYKRNKPLRHVHRRGGRYRTKKYPVRFKPYGVSSRTSDSQLSAYMPCINFAHLLAETIQLSVWRYPSFGECMPSSPPRTSCADSLAIDSTSDSVYSKPHES